MANELRIYQDFLGGQLSAAATNVQTTLDSPAFAAMAVVDATNHMLLTLDPDGIDGAPEVVKVTAHAAASTTVTVARAQNGTAARAHADNTDWVAPVLASDMQLVVKFKTADESVASSVVLQNDDHLTFAIGANETWVFDATLHVVGPDAADIAVAVTWPGGATGIYAVEGRFTDATSLQFKSEVVSGTAVNMGTHATNIWPILVRGTVENGATPGAVTIQWAQLVSNATNTTVKRGSSLIAKRVF